MKILHANEIPKVIEPWRIIAAYWSGPDYSEERSVVADLGEINDGYVFKPRWVVIQYTHCSCYDFPTAHPYATEHTEDELLELAESKMTGGCYYAAERDMWKTVVDALRRC